MPSQDSSRDYDLLDRLVEEFNDRFRRGERPSVREYCEKYPALAADLRDLLPALAQVEQAKGAADGAEGPAPTHAPPLEHLGDFHVIREIGRGGMGVVYEAEQVSLGRRVALKVLTARLLQDDRQKRRFEREAKAAAKLHHTNIVPVFGTGEQDGTPYYVMQFIQGLGLDLVIEEIARIGPGETSALPHPMSSPPGRRDVSAADVARSLMTGDFGTPASGPSLPQPGGDAVTLTSFAADARTAPALTVLSRSDPSRPAADPSALSSVSLPGQSETAGRRRRLTYWQSVAWIGSSSMNRCRSSRSAAADWYRRPTSFSVAFWIIVSRSRGTPRRIRLTGSASWVVTCLISLLRSRSSKAGRRATSS